jgi:hypothetical protein
LLSAHDAEHRLCQLWRQKNAARAIKRLHNKFMLLLGYLVWHTFCRIFSLDT